MPNHFNHDTQQQITGCLHLLHRVLGNNLLGVYLYGSSIIGGLQKYSDLDLLVVTEKTTSWEQKKELIQHLLQISGLYMKGTTLPIELTIVVKSQVNPWHYPPHFDFQYGEWLREEFKNDNIEPWTTKEMPDLAILITQILLANQTLTGAQPQLLLHNVPYKDFMAAQVQALDSLMNDLDSDTRNVLLTLARIWSTVETDSIHSKPAAADWAITHLPPSCKAVMQRAKNICTGKNNEYWDDISDLINACAEFIVCRIKQRSSLVQNCNFQNKTITLA